MHPPSSPAPASTTGFGDFLEAARPKLYSMLASYKVPPEDADDLLHDAILALLKQGTDGVANPQAWLLGILRIKILDYRRWRARQSSLMQLLSRAIVASEPPPQLHLDAVHDLLALTAHLPARVVTILWLRFGLGRKPREVAQILRCRPDSVRKLTRRALELAQRNVAAAGHLQSLWRMAPAAGSRRPVAAPPRIAAAGKAARSQAVHPVALAATVRRPGDPRGDLRRGATVRRSAEGITSPPERRRTP
ncbi:MAG TPA: sigma-70 family RNA polymerase sigma factor [Thermoanaerobaculia bacterium]|jgi:RNA polymerase sigma factor (sigma-70 family)|nr:sigma-70 family RNA polymerase sigma factor [Thermoanaerobaculia bacterium]